MKAEATVVVRCPIAQTFDLLSAPERAPEWAPTVERMEKATDGPVAVGTQLVEHGRVLGKATRTPKVVELIEPPTRYAERATGGLIPYVATFELRELEPGRTEVTMRLESDGSGKVLGLVGPLLKRTISKQLSRALAGLKSHLER